MSTEQLPFGRELRGRHCSAFVTFCVCFARAEHVR